MWREISDISGLPFPERSPAGVDADLYERTRAVTSLGLDFHLASQQADAENHVEIRQLQQNLLQSTNHAAAIEIEVR